MNIWLMNESNPCNQPEPIVLAEGSEVNFAPAHTLEFAKSLLENDVRSIEREPVRCEIEFSVMELRCCLLFSPLRRAV
jgi:hypothetical protein